VLIDDVPIWGHDFDPKNKGKMRGDAGYHLLVVAELHWPEDEPGEPFTHIDPPVMMLRLVRAMSKSNTLAWKIVFDELGYEPDFIVADSGTGIGAAVREQFDPNRTKFIPSLWHLAKRIEWALTETPGAREPDTKGRVLIEPLQKHLHLLSRRSGVLSTPENWQQWWNELLELLKANKLPTEEVLARRKNYERAMIAVIPYIAVDPNIPVSTGGLEMLISKHLSPLLATRQASFANIERTNMLFDMAVARNHNAFDNLSAVADLLRQDSEEFAGWTVALRSIADPRPKAGRYSSLRDETLLTTIAQQRGIK
jgi:hypothetical protein